MIIKNSPVKNLRIGRVYLIEPIPLPGMKVKQRPGIYAGQKVINNKIKYLFFQIGTSQSNDFYINKFDDKKLDYFWKQMHKKSFIHLDVSKYESLKAIKHPYKAKGKFVEMRKKDLFSLKNIYFKRIKELEIYRLKKAKIYAINGDFKQGERQLKLLKLVMPVKHKKMYPKNLIKKWKKQFDSI